MIHAMENEFLNSMYYLLPALSRLMGAAERDARPESYDDKRVETLMDFLEQVISKFAQTPEGAGLRNTEAACALLWWRGSLRTPRLLTTKQPERTRRNWTNGFGEAFSQTLQEPVNLTRLIGAPRKKRFQGQLQAVLAFQ